MISNDKDYIEKQPSAVYVCRERGDKSSNTLYHLLWNLTEDLFFQQLLI